MPPAKPHRTVDHVGTPSVINQRGRGGRLPRAVGVDWVPLPAGKQARSFRCRHAGANISSLWGVGGIHGGIHDVGYPGLSATIGTPPAAGGPRLLEKGSAGGITVQAG